MTITAKFAGTCPTCSKSISAGDKVEWSKGAKARHVACGASATTPAPTSRNWDPTAFAGRGRPLGGYRRACRTDGNCSSFGSGRSCGGHDCDGR